METDDAEMIWRGIKVPISYKYDLSVIFEDVVEMLKDCLNAEATNVYFGSNTFFGSLAISPLENDFRVIGEWESVSGSVEHDLNGASELVIDKAHFLKAWSELLKSGAQAVSASNLRGRLRAELNELQRLFDRVDSLR